MSRQDYYEQEDTAGGPSGRSQKKTAAAIPKIKVALKFMRNQQFEVRELVGTNDSHKW